MLASVGIVQLLLGTVLLRFHEDSFPVISRYTLPADFLVFLPFLSLLVPRAFGVGVVW